MGDELILELDDSGVTLEETQTLGGTRDYNKLKNKPSIGGVTLQGEKNLSDFIDDYIIIDGGVASGYVEI